MGSRAGFLGTMLAVAAAAHPAGALTLLTCGKVGDFRPTRASVRVGADRALRTLRRPTCPAVSSVRFALSRRGDDFEDHGEVALAPRRGPARAAAMGEAAFWDTLWADRPRSDEALRFL